MCVLDESGTVWSELSRKGASGGGWQVPLDPYLMLGICSLSLLVLHETLLVPFVMYGSKTVLWKEKERSRIRAVQVDNLVLGG